MIGARAQTKCRKGPDPDDPSRMTRDKTEPSEDRKIRLAAIQHSGGKQIDSLIHALARELRADGVRVGGAIQANVVRDQDCHCDMELEELTSGRTISISQQLGLESRGCRLNDRALDQVVALVDASLRDGLEVLILNKFGKQEADGRGLRNTIAQAAAEGIPVLVGLNQVHAAAWHAFCGGEGTILEADRAAIMEWLRESLPGRSAL